MHFLHIHFILILMFFKYFFLCTLNRLSYPPGHYKWDYDVFPNLYCVLHICHSAQNIYLYGLSVCFGDVPFQFFLAYTMIFLFSYTFELHFITKGDTHNLFILFNNFSEVQHFIWLYIDFLMCLRVCV